MKPLNQINGTFHLLEPPSKYISNTQNDSKIGLWKQTPGENLRTILLFNFELNLFINKFCVQLVKPPVVRM